MWIKNKKRLRRYEKREGLPNLRLRMKVGVNEAEAPSAVSCLGATLVSRVLSREGESVRAPATEPRKKVWWLQYSKMVTVGCGNAMARSIYHTSP